MFTCGLYIICMLVHPGQITMWVDLPWNQNINLVLPNCLQVACTTLQSGNIRCTVVQLCEQFQEAEGIFPTLLHTCLKYTWSLCFDRK